VLGSRRSQRTVAEAAVPVDVISSSELVHQGDRNLLDVLASSAPSFNVSREAISDAATMVRPFSLRGLPSDSTLVLVNGKRQHRGAVIGEFVAGVQRGAQGVDLYALPGIALARVELLRDGSSAQYGSDAIAGVINLVLADRPTARAVDLQWGRYYRGDGAIANIGAQLGFALGAEGGLTLSAEWRDARIHDGVMLDTEGQVACATAGNVFALVDGRWRKHLRSLRERLAQAHQRVAQQLENIGFELFCEPKAGMFLWARHPDIGNATELAYQAAEQDILLGPGHLFTPDLQPSPWLRFNVAFTQQPPVLAFLQEQGPTAASLQP
jgi:hypothetical protein